MIELIFDGKNWWVRTGTFWFSPDVGTSQTCEDCGNTLRLYCMCDDSPSGKVFDAWICTGTHWSSDGYKRLYTDCYMKAFYNDWWRKIQAWWPPTKRDWEEYESKSKNN